MRIPSCSSPEEIIHIMSVEHSASTVYEKGEIHYGARKDCLICG